MTTDKTTALIEAAALIHILHMCEQEGISSGMPSRDEWLYAVDGLGYALAAFEQPNLVKKQYENIGTVKIPNRKDMGLDDQPLSDAPCTKCGYNGRGYYQPETHPCAGEIEQPAVREMTVEEVALLFELEGRRAVYLTPYEAAKALAKLGTIRVVEG